MGQGALTNRVCEILELPAEGDRLSRLFDRGMITLILVSVAGGAGNLRSESGRFPVGDATHESGELCLGRRRDGGHPQPNSAIRLRSEELAVDLITSAALLVAGMQLEADVGHGA